MNNSESPWESTFTTDGRRGVRNGNTFICFLPKPRHYTGQDARYNKELRQNESDALLISLAPEMLELLRNIAYPKPGSEHEKWKIEQAADAAAQLLAKTEI